MGRLLGPARDTSCSGSSSARQSRGSREDTSLVSLVRVDMMLEEWDPHESPRSQKDQSGSVKGSSGESDIAFIESAVLLGAEFRSNSV